MYGPRDEAIWYSTESRVVHGWQRWKEKGERAVVNNTYDKPFCGTRESAVAELGPPR